MDVTSTGPGGGATRATSGTPGIVPHGSQMKAEDTLGSTSGITSSAGDSAGGSPDRSKVPHPSVAPRPSPASSGRTNPGTGLTRTKWRGSGQKSHLKAEPAKLRRKRSGNLWTLGR